MDNSKSQEAYKLLMKLYDHDKTKANTFMFTPNYLLNKFTPITLILQGDGDKVIAQIQKELTRLEK